MSKEANKGPDCWAQGTFEIGDAPNPLAVVQEHSKTVLTLATTFLGVSAAFADRLIGEEPKPWQVIVTASVWALLLMSMFFSLFCNAWLHGYLRWENDRVKCQRRSAFCGNIAPWPMFAAGVLVAILATNQALTNTKPDAGAAIRTCQSFLQNLSDKSNQQWTMMSIELQKPAEEYRVNFLSEKQVTASFSVSTRSGKITKFERK